LSIVSSIYDGRSVYSKRVRMREEKNFVLDGRRIPSSTPLPPPNKKESAVCFDHGTDDDACAKNILEFQRLFD
jgi:hypothetical protein